MGLLSKQLLYTIVVDLRYWEEIFMYVVYIRSLIPTSRLKEVISYKM